MLKEKVIVIEAGNDELKRAKPDYLKRKLQFLKKKILGQCCIIHSINYNGGLGEGKRW